MQILAQQFGTLLLFIHIFAAGFWIFGMITIRCIVHPHIQTRPTPQKIEKSLAILGTFLPKVIVAIFLLILTGVILSSPFKGTPMAGLTHAKEGIWTVMTIIYSIAFFRFRRAKTLCEEGNYEESSSLLKGIASSLIPMNLVLGLLAIFFGVGIVKGF